MASASTVDAQPKNITWHNQSVGQYNALRLMAEYKEMING